MMNELRRSTNNVVTQSRPVDAEMLAKDLALVVQHGMIETAIQRKVGQLSALPQMAADSEEMSAIAAEIIEIVEAGIEMFEDTTTRDALGALFGTNGRAHWQGAEKRRAAAVELLFPTRVLDQASWRKRGQPALLRSLARKILAIREDRPFADQPLPPTSTPRPSPAAPQPEAELLSLDHRPDRLLQLAAGRSLDRHVYVIAVQPRASYNDLQLLLTCPEHRQGFRDVGRVSSANEACGS